MDIKTIKSKWTEILDYMKTEFGIQDAVHRLWITPMYPISLKDNKLIVNYTDKKLGMVGINYIYNKQGIDIMM